MQKFKNGSYLTMLIMLAVGVLFLIYPGGTLKIAVRILGAGLLLLGAVGIALPLIRKEELVVSAAVAAVVELIVGVVVLASPGFVISLFPAIMGILIALYGLADLIDALNRKRAGAGNWKAAIVLAAVAIVLGVVVLVNPFKTMSVLVRIAGVILIYEAASEFIIRLKN